MVYAGKKTKKSHESINNRLALVMKSGKYTLGCKTVLKSLRNSKVYTITSGTATCGGSAPSLAAAQQGPILPSSGVSNWSIDYSRSTEDEDEEEAVRSAAINQEIKCAFEEETTVITSSAFRCLKAKKPRLVMRNFVGFKVIVLLRSVLESVL
ncbi:unnamed protein product [Fraxinus pennsylvanica]|uniref:Uncharacterized protein n=1 Tax=Fraxinus pennsylvanica TaxID=56036 RepID=A0AAD1YNS9_9LAMI|nr:unnamed protein product [Fraxinus pennsylvanica]